MPVVRRLLQRRLTDFAPPPAWPAAHGQRDRGRPPASAPQPGERHGRTGFVKGGRDVIARHRFRPSEYSSQGVSASNSAHCSRDRMGILLAGRGQPGQGRLDFVQNRPRQQVVSIKGEMDVLVEQTLAGNAADGQVALRQRSFRIGQTHAGGPLLGGHLADDRVDPRVGAEPQAVQVAGRDKLVAGLRHIGPTPRDIGRGERGVPRSGRRSSPPPRTWQSPPATSACFPIRRRPDRSISTSSIPRATSRIGAARPTADSP